MAKQSKAEVEFRAKYPHANVRDGSVSGFVAVYAGDYLCAEGRTLALAFYNALLFERQGLITPDPAEEIGSHAEKTESRELPPDPEEMNGQRAHAAEDALMLFVRKHGATGEAAVLDVDLATQNLTDLLGDLAHWCDRNGVDLADCWRMAETHYDAETNCEGLQFVAS